MTSIRRPGAPLILVAYGILFVLFGQAATVFEIAPGVSAWYATAGLNLALVALFGPMYSLAVFAATLAGGFFISDPPIPFIHVLIPSLAVMATHALAGTWLRKRWLTLLADGAVHVSAVQFLRPFFVVCALLPFAVAIPSIGSYYLTGLDGYVLGELPYILGGWWLGDLVGLLTVTPLIVLFVSPLIDSRISITDLCPSIIRGPDLNALGHLIMIAGGVVVALVLASPGSNLYFICFLPVLWIAMHHGLLRAVVAVAFTNVFAATGIALFRPDAPIAHLQLFMIALAVTGLLVGALVAERRATIERMKAASARLRSFVSEFSRLGAAEELVHDAGARDSLAYHLQTLESVQRLLAQTAKQLRSLNAEKDRLLAILSHDLRSPLSGIRGLAEVMIDDVSPRDPALAGMLVSIRDAARQSHRLLENLLRWAQLQTGDTSPEKTRIDMVRMVRTAVALADSGALRKAIQVEVDLPQPLDAEGDPEMTGTVIRNLLSNAIKFTPHGGSVSISGRYTASGVEIVVHDTGVGMTDRQVSEVFDIGTKSSTSGTDGEKGTGLGLILCRELAAAQNGDLLIESEQGSGTSVTFRLPLLLVADQLERPEPHELQVVS